MQDLQAAVIHDVKNQLAELAMRLERRGDCALETGLAMSAAQRLTELLLAGREQAGHLRANIDSASPSDLLEELAAEYRALFPGLTIRLELDTAPSYWFFDQALLRLALSNIVHNACRFAQATVCLSARESNGWLEIEVCDDGVGYPQEMLEADIAAAPFSASRHGTGLGLYLASKIAKIHQNTSKFGELTICNRGGAVLLMRLP